MEYYFTAQKLAVGYDNRPLIENIDFSLKRGEILTLIGPNGAGKSTISPYAVYGRTEKKYCKTAFACERYDIS